MQSEAWHKQQEGFVFSRKTTVNFTLNSQGQYFNKIKENMCSMVKFVPITHDWKSGYFEFLQCEIVLFTYVCIPGVNRSARLHVKLSQYLSICTHTELTIPVNNVGLTVFFFFKEAFC